jgi:hypothetical protein
VRYEEFKQRVRRHAPSSLLPLLAQIASAHTQPDGWIFDKHKVVTPWNLAEIARTSLVFGNDHRSLATEGDIGQCCAALSSMQDPDLSAMTLDGFMKFMLRMASQQLVYQMPVRNELARSIALFEQMDTPASAKVIHNNWAEELLGCSIGEYVAVAFLLYTSALKNSGIFSLDWLTQENFHEIRERVPADTIRRVIGRHFMTTPEQFRLDQPKPRNGQHPDTLRYQFNPLTARPVLSGVANDLLIPVPDLLTMKASPLGFYYLAVKVLGNAFSDDLGTLFEAYVGKQLALVDGATIFPEVVYDKAGGERRSIDWFVVFDDVILYVEVKSTRPTESVRAGDDAAADELRKSLAKAVNQITTTMSQVTNNHPAFSHIPHDRPIIGLIVTMEPFYVINGEPFRKLLPECPVPVLVCSAYELEHMVTAQDPTAGTTLLEFANDPERKGWSVDSAFGSSYTGTRKPNSILDRAFANLPWASDEDD